jgi:hypothetical protein
VSTPWYGLYINTTGLTFHWSGNDGSVGWSMDNTGTLAAGTWYHVACGQRNGELFFAVNGVTVNSLYSARNCNGTGPMSFGAWLNGSTVTEHANIQIDDFQVFSGSDVEAAVNAIMNGTFSIAATSYTLTPPNPAASRVGGPSGNWTVAIPNGQTLASSVTVTPWITGGGTCSPATVTLAAGTATSATFTVTPAAGTSAINRMVGTTNNGSLADPVPVSLPAVNAILIVDGM